MKNILKMFFTFGVNLFLGLGYAVLMARLLGVELRGIVYAYQLPALLLSTIVFASISLPLHSYYCKNKSEKIPLKSVLFLTFCSVILCYFAIHIYISLYRESLSFSLLFYVTVAQGMNLFFIEISKFNKSSKKFFASSLVTPFLLFLISVISYLLFGRFDELIAVASITVSYLASFLISAYIVKDQFYFGVGNSVLNTGFIKSYAKYFGFKLLSTSSMYLDKIFIVSFFGAKAAGLVAVCMSLESVSSKLFSYFANYEMNLLSKEYVDQNTRALLHGFCVIVGVIGIIAAYFVGEFVILAFFGAEFVDANQFLIPIIATSVINGIAWSVSQEWLLKGEYKKVYYRQTVGIAIVVIGIGLVFNLGLSAYTMLSVVLLASFIRLLFTLFYVDFSIYKRALYVR